VAERGREGRQPGPEPERLADLEPTPEPCDRAFEIAPAQADETEAEVCARASPRIVRALGDAKALLCVRDALRKLPAFCVTPGEPREACDGGRAAHAEPLRLPVSIEHGE